ncbi:MAG: DUF6320 domain-containing protein [Christensenellales bacterium]
MSYCVNCGVELAPELRECPLCSTAVINPAAAPTNFQTAFAQTRDEQKKINRGFWIKFNSILAAVPIAICVLCNLLHDNTLNWSLIVSSGVFIVWSLCTSPFLFKRFNYIKMLIADFLSINAALLFIQLLLPQKPWFIFLALPITLFCLLFWLPAIFLIKRGKIRGLRIAAAFFVFATLVVVMIEMLLSLYNCNAVILAWSWFAAAPCISIIALLILLDSNELVRHELAKRLHF